MADPISDVPRELVLDDGTRVTITGRPPQGTRHDVLFGRLSDAGTPVAVKLERTPGALARERAALVHLAARGAPVPAPRASGVVEVSARRVACLVVDRARGGAPADREGWRRLGRALGRIAEPVRGVDGLPVLDAPRFGIAHARRVAELGDDLAPVAEVASDWPMLRAAEVPHAGPLVLTHGDPGPGNFLDDGRDGVLIDWEDAHVAPRGLDLARAVFIARLGSGPSGFIGRDHEGRAHAVAAGYRETVAGGGELTRWWLTVAGVQFAHHRRRVGGPGPWEDAVRTLRACLTETAVS